MQNQNQRNFRRVGVLIALLTLCFTSMAAAKDVDLLKVDGILVERQDNLFRLVDDDGHETVVQLAESTEITEDHKNFFREPRVYRASDLRPGLRLTVKGLPVEEGMLKAHKITFTNKARKMAVVMDSSLEPVERQLADFAGRSEALQGAMEDVEQSLGQTRQEMAGVRQTAQNAEELAGEAMNSAESAHVRIDETGRRVDNLNERLQQINDFFVSQEEVILFGPGSSVLSEDAKTKLDELGLALLDGKTLVEVVGFASSDGNDSYNRRLSQRRAETVQRYLIENHEIELRRFVSPFGLGELRPVADNETHQGRVQNRRAEVRVLSSRGLETEEKAASPAGGQ